MTASCMHPAPPSTVQRRLKGFASALTEAGLGFDPDRDVLDLGLLGFAETQAPAAIIAADQAGRLDGITALFCRSDMVAFGIMQGPQSLGRTIPEECSVIGIDDVALAGSSRPPLTTMRIARTELGRNGTALLLARITNGARGTVRMNMGVELVSSVTIAPPPALLETRAQ